jgi:hypothetical protein
MDLNPVFTSSTVFHPTMIGGEFASAGISLVHGWLVNTAGPKHAAVLCVRDYDAAMNLIVKADMLTHGLLVGVDTDQGGDNVVPSQAGLSHTNINLTEQERWKVENSKYHIELPSTTQMPNVQLPPPGLSSDPHKLPISSWPPMLSQLMNVNPTLLHSSQIPSKAQFPLT